MKTISVHVNHCIRGAGHCTVDQLATDRLPYSPPADYQLPFRWLVSRLLVRVIRRHSTSRREKTCVPASFGTRWKSFRRIKARPCHHHHGSYYKYAKMHQGMIDNIFLSFVYPATAALLPTSNYTGLPTCRCRGRAHPTRAAKPSALRPGQIDYSRPKTPNQRGGLPLHTHHIVSTKSPTGSDGAWGLSKIARYQGGPERRRTSSTSRRGA